MDHKIAKLVAAIGVAAVIAACADGIVPPTTSLNPGSALLKKDPKVTGQDLPLDGKVTICHAAGRAGTTHYIRITISVNGLKGHFENNGTPKAGHELDFIETPEHLCNAPEAAQLTVCKQSSGAYPDANVSFSFTTSEGGAFSLKFGECTDPMDVAPGNVTVNEAGDPNVPNAFSYFATSVVSAGLVSSSGFFASRPGSPTDAVATVSTTSGNNTTVTFYNQN